MESKVISDKKIVIRCRAIIAYDGKLLVVKHSDGSDFWAFPGGHLEWGESARECLAREMLEELGVKPKIGRLLYVNTFMRQDKQSMEFFFEVKNGKDYLGIANIVPSHAHEVFETRWVGHSDRLKILPMKIAEDLQNGKIPSETIYIKEEKEEE